MNSRAPIAIDARPPLPWRLKVVACVFLLDGLRSISALRRSEIDLGILFGAVEVAVGFGLLRHNASARGIGTVLMWLFVVPVGLGLVVAMVAHLLGGKASHYFEGDEHLRASIYLIYLIGIPVECLAIWMLRVLVDRRLDDLFDRRKWRIGNHGAAFD
jgi:hypothetical protein